MTAVATRANKYAGRCSTCGQHVAAQAGEIERVNGTWRVSHLTGTCPAPAATSATGTRAPVGIY